MTLQRLKSKFLVELSTLYPEQEILSFFYLLTASQLGLSKLDITLDPDSQIKAIDLDFLSVALSELKAEKPIQYIIGRTEFYGLPFIVDPSALIPRQETEELVDWIIKEVGVKKRKIKILDIGTGSGCIAICLAKNLLEATIYALDVSDKALKLAKKNARLNQTDIHFIKQDILKMQGHAEAISPPTKFDIIVSNPPYVRQLEKGKMHPNVLQNEPHLALFVEDENPLVFYAAIANFAAMNLNHAGALFLEVNQYLAIETTTLLKEKGFKKVELRKDLFGNDRMIRASY